MILDAFSELNWLAVLVATAAYFVVGALWYSPVLFSKAWIAESGVDPQQGGSFAPLMALSLILGLVAAAALALVARSIDASTVAEGLVLGLVVGIGFVVTTLGVTHAYEKRSLKLQLINNGYHVVGLTVAAIIVTAWI